MPAWSTATKPTGPTIQTATATNADNVFDTLADAEEWARTRGLSLNLDPPEGDLVMRSLRYRGSQALSSETFVTAGLFTPSALKSIPVTEVMDIISPQHPRLKVQCLTSPPGRVMESKLVAAQDLAYGQKILVERPSVLVPTALWTGTMNREAVLAQLFNRLSSESSSGQGSQLEKVKALFTGKHSNGSVEEKIIRTNGINVSLLGEPRPYSGIFVTLARCNHHCTPNAVIIWDPASLTMSLFATHAIKGGSEIFIAYTDILPDTEDRLRNLQKTHLFKCVCDKACTSPRGNDRGKSDSNRKKIREWMQDPNKPSFSSWLHHTDGLDASKAPGNNMEVHLNNVLKALTDENLHSLRVPWMELTELLFRISLAKGDTGKKLDGKIKAIRSAWMSYEDVDCAAISDRRTVFEEWFTNPPSCADWRCRT